MNSHTDQRRPLEFKVWHILTQRMCPVDSFNQDYVYLPWDNSKTDRENYRVVDHPLDRKDCQLLQFTGVQDAKGIKIWEGDILYWCYYDDTVGKLFEYWREVVFHQGAFGTFDSDDDLNPFCNLNLMADVVVGNVFENIDLVIKGQAAHLWDSRGQYVFEDRTGYDLWLTLPCPFANYQIPFESALKAKTIQPILTLLDQLAKGIVVELSG